MMSILGFESPCHEGHQMHNLEALYLAYLLQQSLDASGPQSRSGQATSHLISFNVWEIGQHHDKAQHRQQGPHELGL